MTIAANEWMSHLPGDLNITQITIPGTHNSHANRSKILPADSVLHGAVGSILSIRLRMAACQSDDMWQQLQNGVRSFDLRIRAWEKFEREGGRWGYGLCHGSVKLAESLNQVLDGMADFLKNHPTETLLISIKWDQEELVGTSPQTTEPDKNIRHVVATMWRDYRWYAENQWPKLDHVRGRAVLLRRFENDTDGMGINLWNPSIYGNERGGAPGGQWKQMPDPKRDGLSIEERWDCAQGMLRESKQADFNDGIMYISTICDTWFGNGLNCWEPHRYAEKLNPKLRDFLDGETIDPSRSRFGLVITDFCDHGTARKIFESNFSH